MNNKFIVIEGLDGVGKSTASENLSKELDFIPCEWIVEPFEKIKHFIKHGNVSSDVRFLMSIASMKHTSEHVEKILRRGSGVIMSRYVPSMISYYKAYCSSINCKPLSVDPYSMGYIKPDKVFYLDLHEDERLARINQRGCPDKGEDYLSNKHQYRETLISLLKASCTDIININGLSPKEVTRKLINVINSNQP